MRVSLVERDDVKRSEDLSGGLGPHERPWKKSHKERTAVLPHFMDMGISSPSTVGKIIDMTGREARELSSMSEISGYRTHDAFSHGAQDGQFPELVQAVRRLALHATNAAKLQKEQQTREDIRLAQIDVELESARQMAGRFRNEMERKRKLHLIVQQAKLQAGLLRSALMTEALLDTQEHWRALFRLCDQLEQINRETIGLSVMESVKIALSMLSEPVRLMVLHWDPLGEQDNLVEIMHVLAGFDFKDADGAKIDLAYQLLLKHWLPPLRSLLVSNFDPRDIIFIRWSTRWLPFFHGEIRRSLLDMIMLRRIQEAAEEVGIEDRWIAEWIPVIVLGDKEVVVTIRRRLCKALDRMDVGDEGVKVHVAFWCAALPKGEAELLLARSVLPALTAYLDRNFTINPSNQDISPLLTVLSFSNILPSDLFADLLRSSLFPRLRRALHLWMTNTNDGELGRSGQRRRNPFLEVASQGSTLPQCSKFCQ